MLGGHAHLPIRPLADHYDQRHERQADFTNPARDLPAAGRQEDEGRREEPPRVITEF